MTYLIDAATALHHKLTLVTRNVRRFTHVSALSIH
jgi:predicted nucleic acid-binding protein